jgi:hypothetical protein
MAGSDGGASVGSGGCVGQVVSGGGSPTRPGIDGVAGTRRRGGAFSLQWCSDGRRLLGQLLQHGVTER